MKYTSFSQLFKFPWEEVASGIWVRYPNPNSAHVLSEDTIARDVNEGKLYTKRMLTKTNKLPRWGERFVPGVKQVCVVEESVVDPKEKTLTTYTRNIGMSKIMSVIERCVYKVSDSESNCTICERQVWVSSAMFGFSRALESFAVERFKNNAVKAFTGFQHVLAARKNNGLIIPTVKASTFALNKEKLLESKEKIKESAQKAKTLTSKQNKNVSV